MPAASPVAVTVCCAGMVFQVYDSGAVPPVAVTVAVPLFPPLQFTSVDVAEHESASGSVIVAEAEALHPLLSVTVTVYVPTASEFTDEVVSPVLHR